MMEIRHRSVRRLQIVSARLVQGLLAGNYRSVFRGPGVEFDQVREYVDGDDARLIDWNVSSRLGSPYTKVFRDEREVVLFIMVDQSASMAAAAGEGSRRETALIVSSLLALAAIENNDKVGGVVFTDRIENWIPPKKGKKHALRLMKSLGECEPAGSGSDLALALRASAEALKRRGIVFILSDFKTGEYHRELSYLSRKHDVIAVRIHDPTDAEYPDSGLVHLQDPETLEVVAGAGFSARFRRAYSEHNQTSRRNLMRDCARCGASLLEISTRDDPGTRLVQFFIHRGRA
jgi:uncharacterized protein (DUF58 family)